MRCQREDDTHDDDTLKEEPRWGSKKRSDGKEGRRERKSVRMNEASSE